MTLWFIVGFIVWALCILLMLAVFHGGHRNRGHGYEQKLHSRYMVKFLENVEGSIKKKVKKTARTKRKPRTRRKQYRPLSAH
jgi:hypothetical protein